MSDGETATLLAEYDERYSVAEPLRPGGERRQALEDAARIELGLRGFLREGGFGAFTDTFEDLHGLKQLPGIAVQRLMEDGYGFGAEGDWKTAALVRTMKVMAAGLPGGTSFMEDYTYDFGGTASVGAHMLEMPLDSGRYALARDSSSFNWWQSGPGARFTPPLPRDRL